MKRRLDSVKIRGEGGVKRAKRRKEAESETESDAERRISLHKSMQDMSHKFYRGPLLPIVGLNGADHVTINQDLAFLAFLATFPSRTTFSRITRQTAPILAEQVILLR